MAFASMLVIGLGAAIWLGALVLRWIIGACDGVTIKPDSSEQEYHAAFQATRRRLHYIVCAGTSAVIMGTWSLAIVQGKVTPLQGASSVIAALNVLAVMFHVEHYPWPQQRASRRALLVLLSFSSSGIVLISALLPLLTPLPDFADMLSREAVVFSCGALIGVTLASTALVSLCKHLSSPYQAQILATIAARWTLGMGGLVIILAIAGGDSARRVWSSNQPLALLSAASAMIPLIIILIMRGIIRLRLDDALAALPIAAMRDSTLLARTQRIQAAARVVVRCGIGGAISILLIAGATIVANVRPLSAPPHVTAATRPAPPATPTFILVPAQTSLMLTEKDNGVSVILTGGPLVIGKSVLRLAVANAQGQPIPGASVTVVVTPMLIDTGGVIVQAQPDPAGNAAGFSATIDVTQPGTWQIAALVATADQSIHASVVFTVGVADKA